MKGFVYKIDRQQVITFEIPGRDALYTTAAHKCIVLRKNDEFVAREIKKRLDAKRGLKVVDLGNRPNKDTDLKIE